jgi:putative lipoic acid-binding regulatory protein
MQPLDGSKPLIDYPCNWSYRVIGIDEPKMRQAVAEVIGDVPHDLTTGNASSGSKYVSLGLETRVDDEAQRLRLFQRLSSHPDIRFVI